jgi:hypothetical protein
MNRKIMQSAVILLGASGAVLSACTMTPRSSGDTGTVLTAAGSNFALYPVPRGVSRPAGEWNSVRLLVNGSHVEHWLNGVKVVEYELGSPEWEARVRTSKFAAMPLYGRAPQGHIGLQDHGDTVEFRNIRIRELP